LLRIVEFRQIRYSVTAQLAGGALVKVTPFLSDFKALDLSTGSSPPFTNGWQRSTLHIALRPPRTTP